jgi:hypothetical protein
MSVAKTEAELLETSKTIQSIATSLSVFEKKMTEMTRFATQVDTYIYIYIDRYIHIYIYICILFYSCLPKAWSLCFTYINIKNRFCSTTHIVILPKLYCIH